MSDRIDVRDRVPERDGLYAVLRYGLPYGVEYVEFTAAEYDDETGELVEECIWHDRSPHMKGGGGGVVPYRDLTRREKHWRDNFGKVLYWFEPVEDMLHPSETKQRCEEELLSAGLDPEEITGDMTGALE